MPAPTSATPRPWTASQDGHYGFVYLKDATGRRIATMYGAEDTKLERATDIVAAVNSHEALIQALEWALGYAEAALVGMHSHGLGNARRALALSRPNPPMESDNAL